VCRVTSKSEETADKQVKMAYNDCVPDEVSTDDLIDQVISKIQYYLETENLADEEEKVAKYLTQGLELISGTSRSSTGGRGEKGNERSYDFTTEEQRPTRRDDDGYSKGLRSCIELELRLLIQLKESKIVGEESIRELNNLWQSLKKRGIFPEDTASWTECADYVTGRILTPEEVKAQGIPVDKLIDGFCGKYKCVKKSEITKYCGLCAFKDNIIQEHSKKNRCPNLVGKTPGKSLINIPTLVVKASKKSTKYVVRLMDPSSNWYPLNGNPFNFLACEFNANSKLCEGNGNCTRYHHAPEHAIWFMIDMMRGVQRQNIPNLFIDQFLSSSLTSKWLKYGALWSLICICVKY
jgi:hypothetical protein